MKTWKFALQVLFVGTLYAPAETTDNAVQSKTVRQARESIVTLNRIESRRHQTQRRVQWHRRRFGKGGQQASASNPVAPEKYGTTESSVVIDPITRSATGLKSSPFDLDSDSHPSRFCSEL